MIRFFVNPVPKLGLAMERTSLALKATAPSWAKVVDDLAAADVQILHPVALDARKHLRAPRYAVMMHCLDFQQGQGGGNERIVVPPTHEPWEALWTNALVVWSYYPLLKRPFKFFNSTATVGSAVIELAKAHHVGNEGKAAPVFFHAPLGVDGDTFKLAPPGVPYAGGESDAHVRDVGIITTGYVTGPMAEAIEEAAIAAHRCGLTSTHLGPSSVGGMTASVPGRESVTGITDHQLSALYGRARWVSGLRHGEGFELPVLEGLACGARPIVFDLPCYRDWFGESAEYVPDVAGEALIEKLVEIMSKPPRPVTVEERDRIIAQFDWIAIGRSFWESMRQACLTDAQLGPIVTDAPETRVASGHSIQFGAQKRKAIWVGDSPTTDWTGFGRASRHIVNGLLKSFDVTVLGTTSQGFPYDRDEFPYDVWPMNKGLGNLVTEVRPDVVILQHDPWHVQKWIREAGTAPCVAMMPIDGKNCRCDYLNGLALAIWWTKFAEDEARIGGYIGKSAIVPLGVDTSIYRPLDRRQSRERIGLPKSIHDAFIVGVVARNQPRKRLDLTVRHFAEWVKARGRSDAYLYIQAAPTGEAAYDVSELMRYEKLSNRIIVYEPGLNKPTAEAAMPHIYSSLDVYFSTTQGEGWGLPVMEAMACGVPIVAPDWSGLGDWAKDAAHLVPIAEISATINSLAPMAGVRLGVLGGVPDRNANVEALDLIYRSADYRKQLTVRGLELVNRDQYRWENIAAAVTREVANALDERMTLGGTPLPAGVAR